MCHIITLDRIVREKVSYLLLDKSYYCIFSMIVLGNLSFRVGRLVKSNLIVESVFGHTRIWSAGGAFAGVSKSWGQQKMKTKKIQACLYRFIENKKLNKNHLKPINWKLPVFVTCAFENCRKSGPKFYSAYTELTPRYSDNLVCNQKIGLYWYQLSCNGGYW